MIELYILIGIALVIVGLWAALKISQGRFAAEHAERQAVEQRAAVAEQVNAQAKRTAQSVEQVQTVRAEKQRAEQAQIATGQRDHFDSDGF